MAYLPVIDLCMGGGGMKGTTQKVGEVTEKLIVSRSRDFGSSCQAFYPCENNDAKSDPGAGDAPWMACGRC